MGDADRLAEGFETYRAHLRRVAYRMLGSLSEADDAVQEAWLRLARTDTRDVENLGGWLTRVVSRICLDMLRRRTSRREDPLAEVRSNANPEEEAVLSDEVGLALLVVLDRLGPAERVAFVLHDLFAVPFDEIAPIVERTPTTTKKLASRARQRIQATPPSLPPADMVRQRHVVDAFLSATRDGDLGALLAVLDPDVVRRADRIALPAGSPILRGARAVAEDTRTNMRRAVFAQPVLVAGQVGLVVAPRGRLRFAITLRIEAGKITEIEVIGDKPRLAALPLALLPDDRYSDR